MTDVNPAQVVNETPAPAESKQSPKKAQSKQPKAAPNKTQAKQPKAAQPKANQSKGAQPKAQPKATPAKQPKAAQSKTQPKAAKGKDQPKPQAAKDQSKPAEAKKAKTAPEAKAAKSKEEKKDVTKQVEKKEAKQEEKKEEVKKEEKPQQKAEPIVDTKPVDDDQVKIEEIPEGSSVPNDLPALEEVSTTASDATAATGDASAASGKINRLEKKSRKAISKLGLKPVFGIERVTVKKAQDILFVIAKPDIYKTQGSDTYVIFGEAKIENLSNSQLASKVKEVIENHEGAGAEITEEKLNETAPVVQEVQPQKPKIEEITTDEPLDESGLDPADIDILVGQSNVSRARAVKALKETNGDIVNAIMKLTPTE